MQACAGTRRCKGEEMTMNRYICGNGSTYIMLRIWYSMPVERRCGMYLEVFLLDNFLLDLLLLRLAAAMAARRLSGRRAAAGAAAGALLAWLSLYVPALISLPGKLLTGMLLTLCFPFRGGKTLLQTSLCVFAAAFLVGGIAFAAAFRFGSTAEGYVFLPDPVRALLAALSAAAVLPSLLRRYRRARRRSGFRREFVFSAEGREYVFSALIDTGNALCEPLSGRSVAIVYMPHLEHLAHIPIPAKSISEEAILFAFAPEDARVNGRETDVLIAFSKVPLSGTGALLPAALAERQNEEGEAHETHHQQVPCGFLPRLRTKKSRLLR